MTLESEFNKSCFASIWRVWKSDNYGLSLQAVLDPGEFRLLLTQLDISCEDISDNKSTSPDKERSEEFDELVRLLLDNRTQGNEIEALMAKLVALGCLGQDHLWSDLGLNERKDLSRLLLLNFYPLASKNNWDMRWKKFFYRQICESKRGLLCRAPSCNECTDYETCYSAESA